MSLEGTKWGRETLVPPAEIVRPASRHRCSRRIGRPAVKRVPELAGADQNAPTDRLDLAARSSRSVHNPQRMASSTQSRVHMSCSVRTMPRCAHWRRTWTGATSKDGGTHSSANMPCSRPLVQIHAFSPWQPASACTPHLNAPCSRKCASVERCQHVAQVSHRHASAADCSSVRTRRTHISANLQATFRLFSEFPVRVRADSTL